VVYLRLICLCFNYWQNDKSILSLYSCKIGCRHFQLIFILGNVSGLRFHMDYIMLPLCNDFVFLERPKWVKMFFNEKLSVYIRYSL